MCAAPECDTAARFISIRTQVPNTPRVRLLICPHCDTRRCGVCVSQGHSGEHIYVQDPHARHCPMGHIL